MTDFGLKGQETAERFDVGAARRHISKAVAVGLADVGEAWIGRACDEIERLRARVEKLREAVILAEHEMALLMSDYHAPAYRGMDVIRQTWPLLRQALAQDASEGGKGE